MSLLEISFKAQIPEAFTDLLEPKRYKVYYGGRGAAKSWAFAQVLLAQATMKPMRILCTRELQVSILDSVHKLLSDQIELMGLQEFYQIQAKTILGINGSEFIFKGLKHNSTEIKSTEGIDIAWVEEAEAVSNKSWEVLIPTVRKEGSEIWLSFNTKQPTDATYKRFVFDAEDDAIIKKVSWRDNPFFTDTLDKERLKLQRTDPKAYAHVWEGDFDIRFSGAIYARWIDELKRAGKISDKVQHDPEYPVSTLWDMGYGDTNTIWFYQEAPNEVLFIDYYENSGEGLAHYLDIIKDKPFKYLNHYVPQDAKRKLLEANGRSIVEQAYKDHGIRMTVIPETTHTNRHAALRKALPSCWFNATNCNAGIEALMSYHYQYDEELQVFKKDPVHDWSSHASCALELLPSVWRGKAVTTKQLKDQEIKNTFFRLRRENNLDKGDPYRVKPL